MRRPPTEAEVAEENLRHWEAGSRDAALRECGDKMLRDRYRPLITAP